jgi:glucose-1-phosphate adenylyltransferase
VFDTEWPIYARAPQQAPAFLGESAVVSHSVVTQGSSIEGSVENSVIAHSVTVGAGAKVRYSVVMPGVTIEPGATVEYAILGEGARIGAGAQVGAPPEAADDPEQWGIAVIGPYCTIAAGETVAPNKMLDREHKEVLKK